MDLFGYSHEDFATLNAVDVYADPADREAFLRRMAETGFTIDEVRLKRKNGSVFDSERTIVTVKNASGKVIGYQGIIRDITKRKHAEDALRESETKFRSLFEQSMDAINIATPDGSIIEANRAWLDLFGYSLEELPSLNAAALYADPAERTMVRDRIAESGFAKDEVRLKAEGRGRV